MNADRRLRLWKLVVERALGEPVAVEHVCAAAISATGADSVGVTVMLTATPIEMLYASDWLASELEELTMTLGEGPCMDALAGSPTLIADLTTTECLARWPVYAPAAADAGIRAVFAFPLQIGAIRLGVLDLYRRRPGELDREQLADALVLADTICALLLDDGRHNGHPDARRDGLRGDAADRNPESVVLQHPEVHQATGMITVQLGVTAAVALIRLRAHAYTHGRRLRDVAGDVVARTLRFHADANDRDGGGGDGGPT